MGKLKISANIFDTLGKLVGDLRKIVDSDTADYVRYCNEVKSEYLPEKAAQRIEAKRSEVKGKIDSARSATLSLIDGQITKIRKCVSDWENEPINTDFVNQINTLKNCGIKVTRREFDNLCAKSDGSYWEQRALKEIGADAGIAYKVPDADVFEKYISDIENGCHNFCNYYTGSDSAAWEIHGQHNDDYYGRVPFFALSSASAYFDSKPYLNGGIPFERDKDFLLNHVDSLFGLSTMPFIKPDSKTDE